MAKLCVKLSFSLETGPLITRNHLESKSVVLAGADLEKMVRQSDASKLGFNVALKDVFYPFSRSDGKKGATIEIGIKEDLSGLVAKIDGVFEVKLRPGAELGLQVKKPDLRFRSVTWNGGYWNGFEAFPVGIDANKEFFKFLPKVVYFELK